MFASLIRQQTRTVLAASRIRLPVLSAQVSRSRIALHPSFRDSLRSYSTLPDDHFQQQNDDPTEATDGGYKRYPPSNTIYVGNLSYSVDEKELHDRFCIFGRIEGIRVGRTFEGTSRGFAHIDFASKEDARRACEVCEFEPIYIQDRDVRVDYAPPLAPREDQPPHYKLYIRQFDGDADALREVFRDFSSYIVRANKVREPSGNFGRAGWVDFINVARAAEARNALQGTSLPNGQKLVIDFARKRKALTGNRPGFRRDGDDRN